MLLSLLSPGVFYISLTHTQANTHTPSKIPVYFVTTWAHVSTHFTDMTCQYFFVAYHTRASEYINSARAFPVLWSFFFLETRAIKHSVACPLELSALWSLFQTRKTLFRSSPIIMRFYLLPSSEVLFSSPRCIPLHLIAAGCFDLHNKLQPKCNLFDSQPRQLVFLISCVQRQLSCANTAIYFRCDR